MTAYFKESNPIDSLKPFQIELHRHLEGGLFVKHIIELAEQFDVPFDPETIALMRNQVEKGVEQRNLVNFINMLSTRWMRLLMLKVLLKPGRNAIEANQAARHLIREYYNKCVDTAHAEGIRFINLLFSPFNLAKDGDLHQNVFNTKTLASIKNMCPEEERLYANWAAYLETQPEAPELGLTWEEYVTEMGDARENYDKVQKSKFMRPSQHVEVMLTVSLRRDRDYSVMVEDDKTEILIEKLTNLFLHKKFDIVDICGDETNPNLKLATFNKFLERIANTLPFSVHAGELHYKQRKMARENLRTIVELGNLENMVGIAHAVRLLDLLRGAFAEGYTGDRYYLEYMISQLIAQKVAVLLNLTSNEHTQTIWSAYGHRLLHNMLDPRQSETLIDLLIALCTDDPVIFYPDPRPLGNPDSDPTPLQVEEDIYTTVAGRKHNHEAVSRLGIRTRQAAHSFKNKVERNRQRLLSSREETRESARVLVPPTHQRSSKRGVARNG